MAGRSKAVDGTSRGVLALLDAHLLPVFLVLAAVMSLLELTSLLPFGLLPALAVTSVLAILTALALRRPHPLWAWVTVALSMLLLLASGGGGPEASVAGVVDGVHDYSTSALSWPGHVALLVGLAGMTRSSRSHVERGALLDASVLGLSALLGLWSFLVVPSVGSTELPLLAQLLLPLHAALTTFMVSISIHVIARARKALRRAVAGKLLLASFASLLAGNVLYLLSALEVGDDLSQYWKLPFGLAAVMLLVSFVHPSAKVLIDSSSPPTLKASSPRVVVAASSLALPALVILVGASGTPQTRPVSAALALLLTAVAVTRLVSILREHLAARRAHEQRALHDSLTGLANRPHAFSFLTSELTKEDPEPLAVLFLDLDRFKYVNDTLGHASGDALLLEVAERLKRAAPAPALVSRLGGDEFVVVLPGALKEAALDVAERIRLSLKDPFEVPGGEAHVGTTVGVALHRAGDGGDDASSLVHAADTALYQAKAAGRDRVMLYDDEMAAQTQRRLLLEGGLRGALAREEISVVFQPVVETRTGRVVSSEALVRWTSPDLGPVSPEEFIPIAEDTGMVVEIGMFVLRRALECTARWRRDLGSSISVAVNVSARQVAQPTFAAEVAALLEELGLEPHCLELELTERVLVSNAGVVGATLRELRELGVLLAVDDFGTGYSSLAYLRTFPVTKVKVDRAFVSEVAVKSSTDRSLVEAVLAMAQALGLETTAEGVETCEQASALLTLGCDLSQGYLYSEPLEPDAFAQYLREA
jgi:diguanylate cyclase (GGDEF)-like protein